MCQTLKGSCIIDVGRTNYTCWDEKEAMDDNPHSPMATLEGKKSGVDLSSDRFDLSSVPAVSGQEQGWAKGDHIT